MAKLIFILDDEQEIEVPLPQQVTIGRQDGNDVIVDDPRISARHAVVIKNRDGNFEVRDLGSKGGTFVNGSRMEKRVLQPGDRPSFGPLKCVFLMEETERPVAPSRPTPTGGGHKVLTGILEATSHPIAAEQEGPRLTGNAFSSAQGSGPDTIVPPKSASPAANLPGPSGTYVAPRSTQPHPSVSNPRSLHDERRERSAADLASKPVVNRGASGVLKSILRTVGIKQADPPAEAPPATRNTVTPRSQVSRGDDTGRSTLPQPRDAGGTQPPRHPTSHSREAAGIKPLAGLNHGPQPKGTSQSQDATQAELIERVPVYTYAVQPKTRSSEPTALEQGQGNTVPEAPVLPVAENKPGSASPIVAPPASPTGTGAPLPSPLSPLPPMPAGMVHPPLPPLPPLPASMRPTSAVSTPAPVLGAGGATPVLPSAPTSTPGIQTGTTAKVRISTSPAGTGTPNTTVQGAGLASQPALPLAPQPLVAKIPEIPKTDLPEKSIAAPAPVKVETPGLPSGSAEVSAEKASTAGESPSLSPVVVSAPPVAPPAVPSEAPNASPLPPEGLSADAADAPSPVVKPAETKPKEVAAPSPAANPKQEPEAVKKSEVAPSEDKPAESSLAPPPLERAAVAAPVATPPPVPSEPAATEPGKTFAIPNSTSPSMDAQRAQVSHLVKDLEGKQSNLMQSLRALTDRKHSTQAEMERMVAEVRRSVTELDGLKTQIATRQEELQAIDREAQARHAHLTQLTAEQQRLTPVTSALQDAENRHNELVLTLQALAEQREARESDLHHASEEIQNRSRVVSQLQTEEQRLAHVTAALMEGEGRYGEMVAALQALSEQHDVTHNSLKSAAEEVRVKSERVTQLGAQDEWYVQSIAHRQTELTDAELKLTETLEAINQGVARHEELVRGLQNLDLACGQRQLELQHLADATTASTQELETVRAKIREVEDQHRDLETRQRATETQLRSLETDVQSKTSQFQELEAGEKRLQTELEALKERELAFQGAASDAESKHAGWLTAIQTLGVQHDQKQSEIQRLHSASEAALRELEAMTSNKEQMSVHLLSLLKEQEAIDSRLAHMRKQSDDAETKAADLKALVEKREDEARSREKQLAELEHNRQGLDTRIAALTGTEEKLLEAKKQLVETGETQKRVDEDLAAITAKLQTGQGEASELESRIGELKQRLESLHIEITESRANLARDQKTHEEYLSVSTEARSKQETYREALDKQLESLRADLAKESQKLAETMSQREELDRQCVELAETGSKLAETKAGLQKSEAHKLELDSFIKELEGKRDGLEQIVGGLHGDEESTKGRLEVLRGREKDLRQVLDELAERERNERERFEAIRRLSAEADKEHNEQRESLLAKLDGKRRELADLEMKLTPLREWKECMDIRYARLASLPEDSESARELWREIETEKSNLRNLIVGSPGGTRSVSLGEAVLRGLSVPSLERDASTKGGAENEDDSKASESEGGKGRANRFGATASHEDDDSPEERANVGHTGTGAMLSNTGQEMALKSRLNRLRESVQREATRLEFLRQERAREEMRNKTASGGEAMLKEQDRQLETKLRREEERLATIQRKLELAEMEEEKRRDRITEMERKLAELKSDIVEAERDRSAARHHAEIAQVELKVQEDTLKRVADGGGATEDTSVLASLIGAKKNRPGGSNLKPMGTPKE